MIKKLDYKVQLIICCVLAAIFVVSFFILWLADILPLVVFLILLLIVLLLFAFGLSLIVFFKKEQLRKIALKQKLELEERERKLKEIYQILGIDIQYNEDGSVKDIFDLLNLKPIYDANGVRILTPYELLKINPRFDEDGKEVPNVFIIKNRVAKVARGIIAAPSFVFKPAMKASQKKEEGKQSSAKPAAKPDKKKSSKGGAVQTYIKPNGSGKAKSGGKFDGNVNKSPFNDMPGKIISLPKKADKKKDNKESKPKQVTNNIATEKPTIKPAIKESVIEVTVVRFKPVKNPKTKEKLGGLRNKRFKVSIEQNIFVNKNVTQVESLESYADLEKGM